MERTTPAAVPGADTPSRSPLRLGAVYEWNEIPARDPHDSAPDGSPGVCAGMCDLVPLGKVTTMTLFTATIDDGDELVAVTTSAMLAAEDSGGALTTLSEHARLGVGQLKPGASCLDQLPQGRFRSQRRRVRVHSIGVGDLAFVRRDTESKRTLTDYSRWVSISLETGTLIQN